jgi:hypothetical protein
MSLVEVVTILLSLADFGVRPSPGAPSAAEVLRLAPDRPDAAIHVDLAAFLPNNHRALTALATRLTPGGEARAALDEGLGQLAVGRAAVKLAIGLDPIDDLTSVTGFVAVEDGAPRVLAVVRGRFPADFLDRAARSGVLQPQAFTVDGRPGLEVGGGQAAALVGKDLVVGWRPWVEARMGRGYRRAGGPTDAWLRDALGGRPFFALVAAPGQAARDLLASAAPEDAAEVLELLAGFEGAELHVGTRGMGWSVGMRDAAGLEAVRLGSEAAFDLLRAYQFFGLGIAKGLAAALPALARREPELAAAVLPYRDALLALVPVVIGDGRFVSSVAVRGRRVVAAARAASVGRILGSLPVLVGAGAAAALLRGKQEVAAIATVEVAARPPVAAAAPAPAPRGLDFDALYARLKAERAAR